MDVNLFGEPVPAKDGSQADTHIDHFSAEFDYSDGERFIVADRMRKLAAKLSQAGDSKRAVSLLTEADRYQYCRQLEVGRYCERCRSKFSTKVSCRSRLCERCGRVYEKKLRQKIVPIVRRATSRRKRGYVLALLTLTVRTDRWGDRMPDRDDIKRLYKETSAMLRLNYGKFAGKWTRTGNIREDRKRKIGAGWLCTLEVGKDNNNAHCHAIVYGPYRQFHKLRSAWERITGDSMVVDIRPIHSPSEAVRYILKYICKPPQTDSYDRVAEYAMMVKGTRRLRSGGIFYNAFTLAKPDSVLCQCAVCGGSLRYEGPLDPSEWGSRIDLFPALRAMQQAHLEAVRLALADKPAEARESLPAQMSLWQDDCQISLN